MAPSFIRSPVAHVFIDFDYTLVPEESTARIMQYALADNPAKAKIQEQLSQMGPKTSAEEISSSEIWTLMKAATLVRKQHVQRYVDDTLTNTPSYIPNLIQQLQSRSIQTYILSAAFQEWIRPIAVKWGIPKQHVMANQMFWLGNRCLTFRPSTLLLKGKSHLLSQWLPKNNITGPVIMVGDSKSDYRVYQKGLAQGFLSADYYTPKPMQLSIKPEDNIRRVSDPKDLFDQIIALLEQFKHQVGS